jgi:hypothetical protein
MLEPEVCDYSDSGKFAVISSTAPGGDKGARRSWYVGRAGNSIDYWDGE